MRWFFLFTIAIIFLPLSSAIEIGEVQVEDGKIMGKYLPAGLEGKISCYSGGKHILDLVYNNDSIEISLKYFGGEIERILERNPFLKEEIEKSLMAINISGAAYEIEYAGCRVELHDVPTRFLRIVANEIVFSNLNYTIEKVDEHTIKLRKDNFTAMILCEGKLAIDKNTIFATHEIMLISFAYQEEKHIEDAIKNKVLGGEITIVSYDVKNGTDCISYFGNVSVTPAKLEKGKIVLKVDGDEKAGGKIVKINLGKNVCLSDEFKIKFDGRLLHEASNLEDILNPDDDGIEPEYYLLATKQEGIILLVSIPHFSEHLLSIEFIVENVITKTLTFLSAFLIVAVAAIYMFKK